MPLSDITVKAAKPKAKPYKLADGRGLYLLVTATGKYWRLDYRFAGKRKTLALGVYPDVPLAGRKDGATGQWIKGARDKRDDARRQLAADIDPSAHRKAQRAVTEERAANSFELVAREWFAMNESRWSAIHANRTRRLLEKDLFKGRDGVTRLALRPIADINARELLIVLRRIEERGAVDTAHRAKQTAGQVFRYAIATGRAERDPTSDLRGALAMSVERHHASVTEPRAVGALMRAIDGYDGQAVTKYALRLAPLVFVRPGELRGATWKEFNVEKLFAEGAKDVEWRIPAERMKMGDPHLVPLSTQAITILRELHALTGKSKYLFPSIRSRDRPMSENTINAALRRLGYGKDEMTGHGFRSMASTLLNERGWNRDAIERQLAHSERDGVRAAYNYAEHLPERRRMMQAWADYLDELKAPATVVPLKVVTA